MKVFLIAILALFAFGVNAQERPALQQQLIQQLQGMDAGDLNKQIDQMKNCATIDHTKLSELEQKGQKLHQQIAQLCEAGKRDKAQALMRSEGKRYMNAPIIRKVKSCSRAVAAQLKAANALALDDTIHICDQ
ncbi:MAG: hypothetical protein P8P30_03380 [Rickettsiales bacterium]|nr:hypothetical protein [Rickettsiales bacterium]